MTDPTNMRTLIVPGEFRNLAAALAVATPGDTIVLMASETVSDSIVCPDGVVIEGMDGVIIRGPGSIPVLIIDRVIDVRLAGLHLAHSTRGTAALCEIHGATVDIRSCKFSEAAGHGIAAQAGAQLRLKHCEFIGNTGDGIHLEGSGVHAEILDCSAVGNSGCGISTCAAADGYIERFTAQGNLAGILAAGVATRVTCRASTIEESRGDGISARDSAVLRLEGNTIGLNAGHGVAGMGAGSNIIARRNIITCNAGDGCRIENGADAMLDGNTIAGNAGAGIVLLGPGSTVGVFANHCTDNKDGIVATGSLSGIIEDNVCNGNVGDDFSVAAPALRLIRNRIGDARIAM